MKGVASVRITYLGHACFDLFCDGCHVLTDPFLTGNSLAAASANDVKADYILVSHYHGDHVGDTFAIARRTGAVVVTVAEAADMMEREGVTRFEAGNIGGRIPTAFGSVKLVPAIHGSGLPGALACGFVIEMGGRRIYHAGDTALYSDMKLIASVPLDVALLPIGDYYTMGPEDAAVAAGWLNAEVTVPMHYNTFPAIRRDPGVFAHLCAPGRVNVLAPGEGFDL